MRVLDVGPVRDLGLLDSALARPRSSAFGEDAYSSLDLQRLRSHSIVNNHPLLDGSERLGWLCTEAFLDLNGHDWSIGDDDAVALVVDVASGSLELIEIARRLNVVAQDPPTPSQPNVKS